MLTTVCHSSLELFAEMVMAQSSGLQLFPVLQFVSAVRHSWEECLKIRLRHFVCQIVQIFLHILEEIGEKKTFFFRRMMSIDRPGACPRWISTLRC